MDHQNVARVLGVMMDPYQIAFDWVSEKDIMKYTLTEEGVDRVVLVSLMVSAILCPSQRAEASFQLSDVAEGLGYLHSQNVVHGRLRGVSYCPNAYGAAKPVTFFQKVEHFSQPGRPCPIDRLCVTFDFLDISRCFQTYRSLVCTGSPG